MYHNSSPNQMGKFVQGKDLFFKNQYKQACCPNLGMTKKARIIKAKQFLNDTTPKKRVVN